jgi:hypothetical protein
MLQAGIVELAMVFGTAGELKLGEEFPFASTW